jgi:hypothetical protein
MARWKRADPQPRRAGTHFGVILIYTFYRIFIGALGSTHPTPNRGFADSVDSYVSRHQ